MMIEVGMISLVKKIPYKCTSIEDGVATLQHVGFNNTIQRPVSTCPYLDSDGQLVTPTLDKPKRRTANRIDIAKIFRETVKSHSESHGKRFSISRSMNYYLWDMIDSFVQQAADYAVDNAMREGTNRVSPRHVYWPKLDKVEAEHINPDADDWALHLRDEYFAK